jgi:endo-1,4-beta-xylanase
MKLKQLVALGSVLPVGCMPFVQSGSTREPTLRNVFAEHFMVGAALNPEQFNERDAAGAALIKQQFNTITPENVLKWELVHPELGRYDFTESDRFVQFGVDNGMFIVGHTLVWHSQTPRWVFQDASGQPVSRDTLINRMRDHIHTVVGRYRGRIKGWDVVNEALNEDGTLRRTPWYNIIGEDYLVLAFKFAREADPQAELYYNDYSLENAPKRDGAIALIRKLRENGATVHGIGSQGHDKMDWPTPAQQDSTIAAFASLGLQVMITELDVDVLPAPGQYRGADISYNAALQDSINPYRTALPDSVQQALAQRYAELFSVYMKHRDAISRITFWGVSDGDSWLNDWPVRGRTSYPLLFDRAKRPKPAFDAVIRTAQRPATNQQ